MKLVFDYLKEHDVENYGNLNLAKLSSIKIGATAELAVYPKAEKELVELVNICENQRIQYKILGRTTNILFAKPRISEILIFTSRLAGMLHDGELITSECGVSLPALIKHMARLNFGGLEPLSGIPGSLGGAVYNNAGAYGMSISDVLVSAKVYSKSNNTILYLKNEDMRFAYRSSILQNQDLLLLSANLRFTRMTSKVVFERIKEYSDKRGNAQPNEPSLGSVFKRQGEIPVARLIDKLGLKGKRVGGAEISNRHAGFIVNRGDASADDVLSLIEIIKRTINENYGFIPSLEIEILS